MTKLPSRDAAIFTLVVLAAVCFRYPFVQSLGSGGTIAVGYDSATVCGVVAGSTTQYVRCYQGGRLLAVSPNASFSTVSGGRGFFCGVRSGGYSLLCWDTLHPNLTLGLESKRVYYNSTVLLENLAVGDDHVCATVVGAGTVKCWRGGESFEAMSGSERFVSISSGSGFSCGISSNTSRVRCFGTNPIAEQIEIGFGNATVTRIAAGSNHACGLNAAGSVLCRGSNGSGQLNAPSSSSSTDFFSDLALGESHSCAIRRSNGSVICWGGGAAYSGGDAAFGVSFESIVAGSNFTCGLSSSNFSILCWGPGWPSGELNLPLPTILPGPCVDSSTPTCECGVFPQSQSLCSSSGQICKNCNDPILVPTPSPPSPSRSPPPSKVLRKSLLAFVIIGSAGAASAIGTMIWCLWTGVCFGDKKIHNSVQPTITRANSTSNPSPVSRSSTIRRQASRAMRRQRSGTSSKHADKAEAFTLAELAAATDDFAAENKIGAGSFGVVYRGKLGDGREVAIKRGETGANATKKKFQEKESAFDSELAFLSRLHHKNLVRLVGYCEEEEERLLVYEFMKNGALYDHLHDRSNSEKSCSVVNSWRVRIQIALDAARGIEYLHSYAVPPIIHRDIKSSNILLDSNWTARVSDFGLSLMGGQEQNREYRPMKAVGTVGYIDPEYYGLNVLTAKSDVYGLGVVLLELLTGRRAIFKDDGGDGSGGGAPASVVDFAVPAVLAGELGRVLDRRVAPPEMSEAEAVELVAYTAVHCVNLEGKERPTMSDIVANLERALVLCDATHGSISSCGSIVAVGSD